MAEKHKLVLTPAAKSPFTSGTGEYNPAAHADHGHGAPQFISQTIDSSTSMSVMYPPVGGHIVEEFFEIDEPTMPGIPDEFFQRDLYLFHALDNTGWAFLELQIALNGIDPTEVAHVLGISPEEAVAKKARMMTALDPNAEIGKSAQVVWHLREPLLGANTQIELPGYADNNDMFEKRDEIKAALAPLFQAAENLVGQTENLTPEQVQTQQYLMSVVDFIQNYFPETQGLEPGRVMQFILGKFDLPEVSDLKRMAHYIDNRATEEEIKMAAEIAENVRITPEVDKTFQALQAYLRALPPEAKQQEGAQQETPEQRVAREIRENYETRVAALKPYGYGQDVNAYAEAVDRTTALIGAVIHSLRTPTEAGEAFITALLNLRGIKGITNPRERMLAAKRVLYDTKRNIAYTTNLLASMQNRYTQLQDVSPSASQE